jgi:hypothetical protein
MSNLQLEYKEIIQALAALYSCRKLLHKVYDCIQKGHYSSFTTSEDLATAWHKINICRLYTEECVNFEELLQSAMGLIVDAKEMVDSLAAWSKVTRPGFANICGCITDSGDLVFTAIEHLEEMLNCSSTNTSNLTPI